MARPSKLSPGQWAEVEGRLAAGESRRALAREFGVSEGAIRQRVPTQTTQQVRTVAQQVADAQTALAALPVAQQYTALSLAEQMRQIGRSMASAASLSAATAHRMHELANQEAQKIDDADPLANRDALMGVQALTKMGNDAAVLPMQVISIASKGAARPPMDDDTIEDAADVPDEVLIRIAMGQQ